jgi:hypothetical protein
MTVRELVKDLGRDVEISVYKNGFYAGDHKKFLNREVEDFVYDERTLEIFLK